jgi:predicted kinase
VISSDDHVNRFAAENGMTYSQAFKVVDLKAIERDLMETFRAALAAGRSVVIDRTNMSQKTRRRFLSLVPATHECEAVVFELDPAVLQERLDRRAAETGKAIPPFVIEQMRKSYQPPTTEEGFTRVVFAAIEERPAALPGV